MGRVVGRSLCSVEGPEAADKVDGGAGDAMTVLNPGEDSPPVLGYSTFLAEVVDRRQNSPRCVSLPYEIPLRGQAYSGLQDRPGTQ